MRQKGEEERALTFYTTFQYLVRLVPDYKLQYALFYFGWLFQTIVGIVTPIIFGIMINQIVYYRNLDSFISIGLVFLYITVFGSILYYLIYEMYAYLWNAMNRKLRLKMYLHFQKLTMAEYNTLKHGDTVNMIQFWAIEGVNFLIRNVVHNFNNIFRIVICIGIIIYADWRFAIITVLLVPASVLLSGKIGRRVRSNSAKSKAVYSQYIGWLFETVHGFGELRLLGAEKQVTRKLGQKQDDMNEKNNKVILENLLAGEGLANFKAIILLVQYGLMAYLAVHNGMTIGMITILLTLFNMTSDSLSELVSRYMDGQKRISVIQKIKDFLDKETINKAQDGSRNLKEGIGRAQDSSVDLDEKITEIQLSHVSFSYGEGEVLKDISMTIGRGKKIAIVGNSGNGKSTLLNLLLNLYQPTEGCVLVNGKDLRKINMESYYDKISVVFQNVMLLRGTIKENLCMGRNVPEDRIKECCNAASIYDEIAAFRDGLQENVTDAGKNLSGGQRQRIGLARAYLKDSDVIFMDEATASLDVKNEGRITDEWNHILADKIAVVVSHRLNVAMNCDLIFMIKNGCIQAFGTPEQMMENAEFRELFAIGEKVAHENI